MSEARKGKLILTLLAVLVLGLLTFAVRENFRAGALAEEASAGAPEELPVTDLTGTPPASGPPIEAFRGKGPLHGLPEEAFIDKSGTSERLRFKILGAYKPDDESFVVLNSARNYREKGNVSVYIDTAQKGFERYRKLQVRKLIGYQAEAIVTWKKLAEYDKNPRPVVSSIAFSE